MKLLAQLTAISTSLLLAGFTEALEISGILSSQSAYAFEDKRINQQEWQLDVEYNDSLLGGDVTGIMRARWDTVSDLNQTESSTAGSYSSINTPYLGEHGLLDLRELYWESSTATTYVRLGKQQVVWGEADGLKLLDVINPQNFREFILDDFDDSRIPLWMVNAELNIGDDGLLQLLWIPDTTVHELAPNTSPYYFTSPSLVPKPTGSEAISVEHAQAPNISLNNSDAGLRYVFFTGNWDISLNYLYHFIDAPVLRSEVHDHTLLIHQNFERSNLIGASASSAFGDLIFRSEWVYETDRYHRSTAQLPGVVRADQLSFVVGFDWQGWTDQFISLQLFNTAILNADINTVADENEKTLSFLWESNFLNETLKLEWLHIHSINHSDGVLQPTLKYNWASDVDIYLGLDVFYGDKDQLFGEFNDTDRISIGFELGF